MIGANQYRVIASRNETPSTTTLTLKPENRDLPAFRPGQYLNVYFPDLSPTLGKQYSISSSPSEGKISISVKAIGRFSNRLCSLRPNDILLASLPQGNFFPNTDGPITMIAGGMGIMPFRSIIVEKMSHDPHCDLTLLYSAKHTNDMPYVDELHKFSVSTPTFSFYKFLTQEQKPTKDSYYRRLNIDDICETTRNHTSEYMLCGSVSFVLAIKQLLISSGIPQEAIRTEAHF